MANKTLLAAAKMARKESDKMLTKAWAAFCIALYKEENYRFKRIAKILNAAMDVWAECNEENIDPCIKCKDLTDIDIMYGFSSTMEDGWKKD